MEIIIRAGEVKARAELADTASARAVYDLLPVTVRANTWGDEIYFRIPLELELDETAAEVVSMGDLGYWPEGGAFCIFFGPTPVSAPGEIRAASAVNVIGRVVDDPREFAQVAEGSEITLERA